MYSCLGLRRSVLSRPFYGYDLKTLQLKNELTFIACTFGFLQTDTLYHIRLDFEETASW